MKNFDKNMYVYVCKCLYVCSAHRIKVEEKKHATKIENPKQSPSQSSDNYINDTG